MTRKVKGEMGKQFFLSNEVNVQLVDFEFPASLNKSNARILLKLQD